MWLCHVIYENLQVTTKAGGLRDHHDSGEDWEAHQPLENCSEESLNKQRSSEQVS